MSNRPFLPEPIRQVLADIYQCLQSAHLEELVMNVGLICSLYLEISSHLPKDLGKTI
jgi:hypothetical protein